MLLEHPGNVSMAPFKLVKEGAREKPLTLRIEGIGIRVSTKKCAAGRHSPSFNSNFQSAFTLSIAKDRVGLCAQIGIKESANHRRIPATYSKASLRAMMLPRAIQLTRRQDEAAVRRSHSGVYLGPHQKAAGIRQSLCQAPHGPALSRNVMQWSHQEQLPGNSNHSAAL